MAEVNVTKARVWTRGYFPFTMGGRVWRPMWARLDATGPHDLGKGFKGYLCTGPDGTTAVAEVVSGGLVGETLEDVRYDIEGCEDVEMMRRQCESAKVDGLRDPVEVSPEEFWERLAKGRKA